MPLTLLCQKKLVSTKNLIFLLHEEWETRGQPFIWQRITKLLEHISSKVWENCRGLESGPERGGIGSVIELAMAKQVYQKNDHFTTWLVGVLQKFWQLTWRPLPKKFSLLVPGYKVHLQLLPLRFCGSFVLFSIANRESFEFLGWKNQVKPMSSEGPSFFVFFFVMVELWICSGTW